MSALLAAQGQANSGSTSTPSTSRWDALKDLFAQVDANSDGTLSKSEFESALGAGGTNLVKADRCSASWTRMATERSASTK